MYRRLVCISSLSRFEEDTFLKSVRVLSVEHMRRNVSLSFRNSETRLVLAEQILDRSRVIKRTTRIAGWLLFYSESWRRCEGHLLSMKFDT